MKKITNSRSHKAIIKERKKIAEDTYEMMFELEKPIDYKSGQYLWLELDKLIEEDPKGNRRAFSITNPPEQNGTHIKIVFRKSESGYKKSILNLPIGSRVNIIAPFGSAFLFPKNDQRPLILISAGTGVSPFLCLARDLIQQKRSRDVHLLHYEEKRERNPFSKELASMNGNRIQTQSLEEPFRYNDLRSVLDKQHANFFISGPQEFVDLAHNVLIREGIQESQLAYEALYPTPKNLPSLLTLLETHLPPDTIPVMAKTFFQNQIFRIALDTSSSHIVITDLNGVIRYANQTAAKITGFSISEMIGHTPRLWGALMPSNFYQNLWDMKLKREPIVEEITNRRKSGELYHVILHISPINDLNGELMGFMATEEDITRLRNREEELADLTERFMHATSSANIGTYEWDLKSNTIKSDAVLFRLCGIDLQNDPRGAYIAWQSTLDPKSMDNTIKNFQDVLKNSGNALDLKYAIKTSAGDVRILHTMANILRDERGNALKLIGVDWDITHEEAVDRAKTEFVSLASHELRTPITVIRWYTEMLLNDDLGDLNNAQKNYLHEIYEGNKHLVDIVNALLDVSRMELGKLATKMKVVDLAELIEPIEKELQPRIESKHLKFKRKIDPSVPRMSVDPKLFEIILQNLLSNAVKYTPDNGRITCSVNLDKQKTHVVLSVEDTGVGIPSAEHASIFTKLYRATNVRTEIPDGTGLGLYLTKNILDHTGGIVWFESEENKGSAFHVSYPIEGMRSV